MAATGIAPGIAEVAACGITRVGATKEDVFEFAVADWETFDEAETEEFKFGKLEIEVLELLGRVLAVLLSVAFEAGESAELTPLPTTAVGVTEETGMAGLNCTRFWPRFVVLN